MELLKSSGLSNKAKYLLETLSIDEVSELANKLLNISQNKDEKLTALGKELSNSVKTYNIENMLNILQILSGEKQD